LAPISVLVTDETGVPMPRAVVRFTLSLGAGTLDRPSDTTGADGKATVVMTLGTTPGSNELSVLVHTLPIQKVAVAGVVGPSEAVTFNARFVRLITSID